ncbi:MAG: hypothetical protein UY96_C0017G0031 [Parcubacteria group bacterium GW2011_GWB1_56_8]|nr:MAG: hypothetical protein UY96_C0017G0031 [Parcubacteria group bacterium GW2011_GWB1_56_8]
MSDPDICIDCGRLIFHPDRPHERPAITCSLCGATSHNFLSDCNVSANYNYSIIVEDFGKAKCRDALACAVRAVAKTRTP